MILALDLIMYWFHLGRHSLSHLLRNQLLPLSPETVELIKKNIQPGDVLLTRSMRSLSSWAILYATNSPVNHAIIIGKNGLCFEAIPGGVHAIELEEVCDGNRFGVLLRHANSDSINLEQLDNFLQSNIGSAYSYAGALRVGLKCLLGCNDRYHPRTTFDLIIFGCFLLYLSKDFSTIWGFILGIVVAALFFIFLNLLMTSIAKDSYSIMYMRPDDVTPGHIYMEAVRRRALRFVIPLVPVCHLYDSIDPEDHSN